MVGHFQLFLTKIKCKPSHACISLVFINCNMLISEFHEQCAYEKHKNDSRKYILNRPQQYPNLWSVNFCGHDIFTSYLWKWPLDIFINVIKFRHWKYLIYQLPERVRHRCEYSICKISNPSNINIETFLQLFTFRRLGILHTFLDSNTFLCICSILKETNCMCSRANLKEMEV